METTIGTHTLGFEPPDLFHVIVRGDVTVADMVLFSERLAEHARGGESMFLMADLSQMGDIPQAARKVSAGTVNAVSYRGMAFYKASFRTKIATRLLIMVGNLIYKRDNPTEFFDTETAARAWIDERRQRVAAEQRGAGDRAPRA